MDNENKSRTVKTVVLMVAATMLAKVLGLLREMLLASHYGAGNTLAEAFSSAQSIPSSFFDVLFSAAILGCFIPVYNSFGNGEEKEADRFACAFFNMILLLTGTLAILGIVFADKIIVLMTPGLDEQTAELAARLLRIMFPLIIFTGSAYTLVGIMQSKEHFILPAFISAISNAGVIIYFLFIDKALGDVSIYGLAAAYALAWLIQFATLAIPLVKDGFRFKAVLDFKSPEMKKAIKMIPPVMIGSWLLPASLLIGKYFASSFEGVAIFNYANQSYIMIAGILSYSICNYVFPKLSKLSEDNVSDDFNKTVRTGLLVTWFIVIPFTSALHILAAEGMTVLYMRGEFDAAAAKSTAEAVSLMAFGMPAFSAIELLSRMFYSKKTAKVPVISALSGVAVNIAFSYIAVRFISNSIASVASANAISQICAALVLIAAAFIADKKLFDKGFVSDFIKILACGILCFAAMKAVHILTASEPYSQGILKNTAVIFAVFFAGAAVYILSARLFGISFLKGGAYGDGKRKRD